MTIETNAQRWLGLYREPAGSYQVDNSGTPGDFDYLPYEVGTLEAPTGRELLDPNTGGIRADRHDKKVLGTRMCALNFATMIHSHGLDLDGDVTAPTADNWALYRVLETIMGGAVVTTNEGAQTTVQGGSTATAVAVTTGHDTRFQAGGVIACQTVSGSSALELREILSVSSDTVNVKQAFSAVPTTGTAVRGGVTFYLTEDPDTSLQAIIEGREATDGVVLRGLQGGFSLQLPVGGRGQIAFALTGAGWTRLGSSSATVPVSSNVSFLALNPLELTVPTIGSTTRVVVPQAEVSIEPAITYAPQRAGNATETIARMRRQPTRPVATGSFIAPYEDDTWFNARDNRDDRAVFAQLGNIAGSAWLISLPTVQITEVQGGVESGEGIAGQRVAFEARHDEEIAGSTEIGYSAIRIHCV